jgi:hypothetical protein
MLRRRRGCLASVKKDGVPPYGINRSEASRPESPRAMSVDPSDTIILTSSAGNGLEGGQPLDMSER